jgi:hypothetical protein
MWAAQDGSAVAITEPSGAKVRLSAHVSNVAVISPDHQSQTITRSMPSSTPSIGSPLPVANWEPSGLKLTESGAERCQRHRRSHCGTRFAAILSGHLRPAPDLEHHGMTTVTVSPLMLTRCQAARSVPSRPFGPPSKRGRLAGTRRDWDLKRAFPLEDMRVQSPKFWARLYVKRPGYVAKGRLGAKR